MKVGDAKVGDAKVARTPFVSSPSFSLSPNSPEAFEKFRQQLVDAGVPQVGDAVVDCARIECGFPEFGKDISADNLPQEVARDEVAISFTKGCYLGQETVARIDALGHVNKYLVRLESEAALNIGDELFAGDDDGKSIGSVTSTVELPEQSLALGYVRREVKESNAKLVCNGGVVQLRIS